MSDVLDVIKNRRAIHRFKSDPIDQEQLRMILEAGRWAPSFSNLQPWRFIVIKNQELKNEVDTAARKSVASDGVRQAPVVIVVSVDAQIDSVHAIEGGVAAAQNMALAVHSLGLGCGWIGVYGVEAETAIQKLLKLSKTTRVVSLLPVGFADESPKGNRKPLEGLMRVL
jgi:nitroreductase